MKYLIGLTLCVLLVVEATAQSTAERPTRRPRTPRPSRPPRTHRPPPPTGRPSRRPPIARCDANSDCQEGFCCITHDNSGYRRGVCLKLSGEGDRCSLPERVVQDKYLHKCPCVSGLSCEAEKTKDIPFVGQIRINERCANPSASTSQPEQVVTE